MAIAGSVEASSGQIAVTSRSTSWLPPCNAGREAEPESDSERPVSLESSVTPETSISSRPSTATGSVISLSWFSRDFACA